jgi:hypothetical protein
MRRFEPFDRTAQRKLVGSDPLAFGELAEQPRIFGRRQTEAVGAEMDRPILREHPITPP